MSENTPQTPSSPAASASTPPTEIVLRHASSRIWKWLALISITLLIVAIIACVGIYQYAESKYTTEFNVTESHHSGNRSATKKIAILTIDGVIMSGGGYIKNQIDRIREDKEVAAVVVRVNSPGGTVSGSDYILHHLIELRDDRELPIVVSMGSIAASGGYYVSMAVGGQPDAIFAEPTTTTGSIGVIIPHYEFTGLMEKVGVTDDSVASGPDKQILSPSRQMSPEHRELLQAYVDESFGRFKTIIRAGRPEYENNPDKLDGLATGRIFTAEQAKLNGLVDKIGFIEAAIERAAELARLSADDYEVIKYGRPATLAEIAGLPAIEQPGGEIRALLEHHSPQAYYISTTLPALVSNHHAESPPANDR
ncbi:MAG: signal peptide peptidase SppA [bacterium]|nr:signal peptide peptidase SppA [bacterium]